jgi:hypothetical protein
MTLRRAPAGPVSHANIWVRGIKGASRPEHDGRRFGAMRPGSLTYVPPSVVVFVAGIWLLLALLGFFNPPCAEFCEVGTGCTHCQFGPPVLDLYLPSVLLAVGAGVLVTLGIWRARTRPPLPPPPRRSREPSVREEPSERRFEKSEGP